MAPKEAPIPPVAMPTRRMAPYLLAIEDWKAPFEVQAVVDPYSKGYLMRLVNKGLAEYSPANNTYRATKDAVRGAKELMSHKPLQEEG